MTTQAVILIEIAVGKTKEVAESLKGVAGIQSTFLVTGPYDVIAVIEAPDMRGIGNLVEEKIHSLSGVTRTVTCVAMGS
jgi:DNA-binding Lrp family transcriptional regulator